MAIEDLPGSERPSSPIMPHLSPRAVRALLAAASALALPACQQPVFEDPPPRFNTGYGQGAYGRPPVYDAPVAAPDYYADPQPPVTATDVVPPPPPTRPVPPPPSYPTYERPPVTSTPLPPPSAPSAPSPRSYPVGRPVPGKPGYVISPFSPNSGYVDVKGFNSGEQVKDPYSGKIFLVP